MKKTKTLLAILALVLTLGVTLGVVLSVTAASSVVESDWISAPSKTLVKCPGGDCDHSACDYVYSFAVVGDTQNINYIDAQNYVKALANDPSLTPDTYKDAYMKTLYNWILANKDSKNIQYVMGLGDITQSFNTTQNYYDEEWALAKSALSLLDGKLGYSLVRGNHDISSGLNGAFGVGNTYYNDLVALSGETDSEGRPMAGFLNEEKIEDTYRKVIIGDDKYIIFTLEYYPTEQGVAWLNNLLTENADYKAIITLHTFLTRDATFNDPIETTTPAEDATNDKWSETATGGNVTPRELWRDSLSLHANVHMVLSGHVDVDDIIVNQMKGVNGNTVTCMLIDGQTIDSEVEPVGLVTMFYVSADGKIINVEHISSVRDVAGKDAYLKEKNQFELCVDYGTNWTTTPYGNIPTEKYDAGIFHVFLDDNGKKDSYSMHFGSYNTWKETMEAIQAFNGIGGIGNRKQKTYDIIMSKDYTYSDGIAPNQISSNPGVISLDINGKNLTLSNNGVLVPFYNRDNTFVPSFTVKNGNVTVSGTAKLAVLQTSIKDNGSSANLKLEDLNVTYNGSTSNLIGMYPGNAGYKADVNITVKNCDIDTTGAGGAVTVFGLNDTNNNNDVKLTLVGGSITGTTAANTVIYSANADDSVLLQKDASGNYPSIILNDAAAPSEYFSDAAGNVLAYSTKSTSAPYVFNAEISDVEVTPYGVIPSGAYPIDTYPFVLFQNGEVVAGYTSWVDYCTNCWQIKTTVDKNSVLYLRKNYTDPATTANQNLFNVRYLTVDLGEHTLTIATQVFYLSCKNNFTFTTNMTVKNGTIVVTTANKPVIAFNSGNTKDVETAFNMTFNNVTFKSASTFTAGRLMTDAFTNGTYGTKSTLVFNDCTFDTTEGGVTKLFQPDEKDSNNKHDISITINGGKAITSKYYSSNFATFDEERESGKGSPDSLTFGKGSDGKDFYVEIPSSVTAPTKGVNTTKGMFYPVEVADNGTKSQYALKSISTPYGDIPVAYRSEVDYLFLIIKNGVISGGSANWNDMLNAAKSGTNAASVVTVLVRENCVATAYSNWSQIKGKIIIDLNGKTVSVSGSDKLITPNKKNAWNTSVEFKNGNVVLGDSAILVYFGTSANGNGYGFDITFTDVNVSLASGYTANYGIVETMKGAVGYNTFANLTFNNCNFDLKTNAPNKAVKFLGMLGDENNNHSTSAVINGGSISIPAKFTWFTANEDDTFKFGKYEGAYPVIKSASAPSGEFDSVEDGKVKFVETDKAGVYTLSIAHTCAPKTHVNAVIPNCMVGGNVEYWICECGIKYLDEACTNAAESVELGVDKNNHVIDLANTAWTAGEQTHYKACTCGARLEEEAHDGLNCTVCGNQTIGVYKSGDDLYFIEWNGKLLTGKFYVTTETGNEIVPEGWYYADESGKFIKEGFFNDKGTLRYIVDGQTVYTRVTEINGKLYMIDWDGKVLTGKFYITADSANELTTEGWHYTNADGSFIEDGFYDDVDCRRYIVNGKTAYTRVTEIDGKFYMIDWDGEVKTGKFYITADSLNGYLNGEGWYYADENGNFYHDAFYTDGNVKRYILNGKAAYTRLTEINGDYYMIEWDGVVVINTEKFYITASSSKGQLKGAGWYKTDADGKIIVE